jgi:tetratricopeptide (TPR) repeat protein
MVVKESGEALEILQRIRHGEPFWKLAMDHSLLPNGPQGGYVEEAKSEELREEFLAALSNLAPGQVSPMVPLGDHFALLKRENPWPSSNAWSRAEENYGKAIRSGSQGDFPSAQEWVKEALSSYPEHQEALLAQRLLEVAQTGAAERPRVRLLFESLVSLQTGARSQALEILERAARSASDAPAIQTVLGELHAAQGQIPQAIAAYERALASGRWESVVHIRLGATFLQQGDAIRAQHHYQTVARSEIDSGLAHVGLGLVHVRMEQLSEAMKEFRVAVAIDPRLDPAYNHMGAILMVQRRPQDAAWAFEKALSIRPGYAPYLSHLGFALNQLGMFSKAVAVLERALSLAPDDPMVNNHLAIAYYDDGQVEKAISHVQRAKSLGYPVHPEFLAKLAHYRKGS